MHKGLIGIAGALGLASMMVVAGCGSSSSNADGSGGAGAGGGSGGGGSGGADAGTGSAGADGGGSAVTSIAGTKALNALTAAEISQLCDDTTAYFAANVTRANSCKFSALVFAASSSAPTDDALRTNCTSMESNCTQSDASTTGPGAATMAMCGDPPTDCTVTVAQYSACIRDEATAFAQTVGALPACTALARTDFDAIYAAQSRTDQPASCTVLTDACPSFIPPAAN